MNGDTTQKIKAIIQNKYDTFVRIHIHRVYWCEPCHQYWCANNLTKRDDVRVCPNCGKGVADVTFTMDAQMWRALVRPDLEIGPQDRPV